MDEFRKAHGSCQVYEMSKSVDLLKYLPNANDDILTLSAGSLTLLNSIGNVQNCKQKFFIQEISSIKIARFLLLLEIINQEMDIGLQGKGRSCSTS